MDTLTPTERSKRMALIRGKNTKLELVVRKIARSFGQGLRSHVAGLPGKADLVFPELRKIIFVHGCYWHRHPGCPLARLPKSKLRFWIIIGVTQKYRSIAAREMDSLSHD